MEERLPHHELNTEASPVVIRRSISAYRSSRKAGNKSEQNEHYLMDALTIPA